MLAQHLDRIELIDKQVEELNRLAAWQMKAYQIPSRASSKFRASARKQRRRSWPGSDPRPLARLPAAESAGENLSGRSAKGNRFLRRLFCQAAQAAARTKDSYLQSVFKRLVVRLEYVKTIWAVAHRICKIVWRILQQGDRFIEFSESRNTKAIQRAINHHLKALRHLG